MPPIDLTDVIQESLSCQYRKLLDHGGGLAIAALQPVVRDIAKNVAQAVMTALENAEQGEAASERCLYYSTSHEAECVLAAHHSGEHAYAEAA